MKESPNCFIKILKVSLFLGLIFPSNFAFGYKIEGKILLPKNEEWASVIFLSAINSFDDLNAVSEDFIINKSEINSEGYFILTGENIPNEDRIYRLHVCQKGDPIATIMIGGEEENHCHFLMNNPSKLIFESDKILFSNYRISQNKAFENLKNILIARKKPPKVSSKTSRAYRQKQFEKNLRYFADTCQISTLRLLALHYLDYENDLSKFPDFYQNLHKKIKISNVGSPYFNEFEQKLNLYRIVNKKEGNLLSFWVIGVLILGGFLFWFFKIKSPKENPIPKNKMANLSIQERRVFDLLKNGKTNKEISSELNIGISTVKSHLNKIYSKLGIKSRKEVLFL